MVLLRMSHLHVLHWVVLRRHGHRLLPHHVVEDRLEHLRVGVFHEEANLGLFLSRNLLHGLLHRKLIVLVMLEFFIALITFKRRAIDGLLLGLLALVLGLIKAHD